jgi:hypothetical protein
VHSNLITENRRIRILVAVVCVLSLISRDTLAFAAQNQPDQSSPAEEAAAPTIPNDQLDALVAPIALYPDPLLSQVLVASTYPLEIIQLQQWLATHKDLKDKALVEAVKKEGWDPSIQGMAALPDAVKQLAENIKWTTDLGNAFLAQQNDVMDAVQRMRAKAKGAGNLKSNEQMKVETKVVESKTVVVIEQASPQVVYVPSYNPTVVYGPPVYPYPPIVYPSTGAVVAGMAISFGVGVAMGAAWGGGWGYHSHWGGNNNITINNNNNFVNNSNRVNNVSNRQNLNNRQGGGNTWQHNPQHRGGAPYSNKAAARQYGGTARGDSLSNRQANARQNQGSRQNQGQRGAGRQPSTMDRGGGGRSPSNRASGGGAGNMSGNRGGGGGGDRVGNRQVSNSSGSGGRSAFGGGGSSGGAARASSQRGSSSMGGSRGGGRSGGGRSGGGRRR